VANISCDKDDHHCDYARTPTETHAVRALRSQAADDGEDGNQHSDDRARKHLAPQVVARRRWLVLEALNGLTHGFDSTPN
jgi:hypothetical protein